MTDLSPDPLNGDPQRRAGPSIRGYEYQLWLSVEAWAALGESDVLYIEAAEDFEVSALAGESRATQVKDHPGATISLNTITAVKAIENYLEIVDKSPGRSVRYSYLTTASAVVEQDAPFGPDVPGLAVWRQAARESYAQGLDASLELIRAVLQRRVSEASLLQRSLAGSLASFHRTVVAPFTWATNEPPVEIVRERVRARLVPIVFRLGVPPGEVGRVAQALLATLLEVVDARTPVPLDFRRLLQVVEAATHLLVPRNALAPILGLLQSMGVAGPAPAVEIQARQTLLPELPPGLLRRPGLEAEALQLGRDGFLAVIGTMGAGKTTLVRCLVEQVQDLKPFWMRLRGVQPHVVVHRLDLLVAAVEADSERPLVVLDDLDTRTDTRTFEESLTQLARLVRRRAGVVIVTAYARVPARVNGLAGWSEAATLAIPPFEVEEISQLLHERGAPEADPARAVVIRAETGGHPQLVVQRITEVARAGFPRMTADTPIFASSGVRESRADARRLLGTSGDPAARDLLYRLSLCGVPFSRNLALRLAEAPPPIARPGEAFDALDGVWLESVEPGMFEVSPLMVGVGNESLSPQAVRSIHATIGQTYLSRRSISVEEAADLLQHVVLAGEDGNGLANWLLLAMSSSDQSAQREFATRAYWFANLERYGSRLEVPAGPSRDALRMLQFNVAVTSRHPQLPELLRLIDRDLVPSEDPTTPSIRTLFLLQALALRPWPLPASVCMAWADELLRQNFVEELEILRPEALRSYLWAAIAQHVESPSQLCDLFDAMGQLAPEVRARLFGDPPSDDGPLRVLFYRLWLDESRRTPEAVAACLRACDEATRHAREWAMPAVARIAARTASVLLDEGLKDGAAARARVTECIAIWGTSPALEDQLADLSFGDKNYTDALDRWRRILPGWRPEPLGDPKAVFSCRLAAIAAARVGNHLESARLFDDAVVRTSGLPLGRSFQVGLRADAAHAVWLAGDHRAALDRLRDVVHAAARIEPGKDERLISALQRSLARLLVSLPCAAEDPSRLLPGGLAALLPEPIRESPIGACSNPSPSLDLPSLPRSSAEILPLLLARLALDVPGVAPMVQDVALLRQSPLPYVRAMTWELVIRAELLVGGTGIDLFMATLGFGRAMATHQKQMEEFEGGAATDPSSAALTVQQRMLETRGDEPLTADLVRELFFGTLFGSLIIGVARGMPVRTRLEDWVARTRALEMAEEALLRWADEVHVPLSLGPGALEEVVRKGEGQISRLVGCLLCADERNLGPDALLAAHCLLFDWVTRAFPWPTDRIDLRAPLATLIEAGWRAMVDRAFALRAPHVNVPAIQAALAAHGSPLARAAAIVLAAVPATRVTLDPGLRSRLARVAQGG